MDQAMVRRELAARELARRRYGDYLAYVHGADWKRTALSEYLAEQVQAFLDYPGQGDGYEEQHQPELHVVGTVEQHRDGCCDPCSAHSYEVYNAFLEEVLSDFRLTDNGYRDNRDLYRILDRLNEWLSPSLRE